MVLLQLPSSKQVTSIVIPFVRTGRNTQIIETMAGLIITSLTTLLIIHAAISCPLNEGIRHMVFVHNTDDHKLPPISPYKLFPDLDALLETIKLQI